MPTEIIAMLGGSVAGFVMKLISAQAQAQSRQLESMLKKQEVAPNYNPRRPNPRRQNQRAPGARGSQAKIQIRADGF